MVGDVVVAGEGDRRKEMGGVSCRRKGSFKPTTGGLTQLHVCPELQVGNLGFRMGFHRFLLSRSRFEGEQRLW